MEIDYRESVMDAVDDGLVDAREMVLCLVKYMSQDDIKDCMKVNELLAPEITLVKDDNPLGLDRGADGLLLAPEADEGLDHEDDDLWGAKHGPLVVVKKLRSRR
jgi:hypothetical protein